MSKVPAPLGRRDSLVVHSWVGFPFVLPGDMQEIDVMVTDGSGHPVVNALVTVHINTSMGVATFVLAPTGADGISNLLFPAGAEQGNDGRLVTYSTRVQAGDTVTVVGDSFYVLALEGS